MNHGRRSFEPRTNCEAGILASTYIRLEGVGRHVYVFGSTLALDR